MEEKTLYTLLHNCTARLSIAGRKGHGTGFFVASGKILTCAHVVQYAQEGKTPVEVYWNNQTYAAQIIRYLFDLDLAVLLIPLPLPTPLTNHPCVFLNKEVEPFHSLYSYGYPDLNPFGEPSTFDSVGWTGDQPPQLKFKEGQVRPGQSGSPLLNWQTGAVCGLVQETFDRNSSLGGKAILTETVLHELQELVDLQRQFHQQDRRWVDCLTPLQRQKLGSAIPAQPGDETGPIKIFFSYHPKDSEYREQLEKHLVVMRRRGLISSWHAQNIIAGSESQEEINQQLNAARIILLLVSQDFIASDKLYDNEVMRAMERRSEEGAEVIPILVRPTTEWKETAFGNLQPLPKDLRPVSLCRNTDAAFVHIAQEIRKVVEKVKNNP